MDSRATYTYLSKFYDVFDALFPLGGKGNPRAGLLKAIPDGPLHVLDVCVGTAASAIWVAEHNPHNHVVGVDLSESMLAVAQRKVERRRIRNLELHCMSADQMAFADASFDVAMISFALHEFEDALLNGVLREMARVLKPDGRLCIIDFARQAGRRNAALMWLWTLFEPPSFSRFLSIDWRTRLQGQGLGLLETREFSFSNLYVLGRPDPKGSSPVSFGNS